MKTTEYALEKAASEKIHLHLAVVENATQLDEDFIAFLKKHQIGVSVSFDLPLDVHDKHRPFLSGKGSSAKIDRNLKRLLEQEISPGVRVTLSTLNQSRIIESIQYLKALGIRDAAFIGMEKAYAKAQNCDLSPPEPEKLMAAYSATLQYVKELYHQEGYFFRFDPVANMMSTIMSGGSLQTCGMGRDFFSLNTNGDIHTCQRVRVPNFFVANIFDDDLFDKLEHVPENKRSPTLLTPFMEKTHTCSEPNHCSYCNTEQKNPCQSCEYLIFCGSGCAAAAWEQYGCKNYGYTHFGDSGTMGHEKCQYTKKYINQLFWEYIDLDESNKQNFDYWQQVGAIKKDFWKNY